MKATAVLLPAALMLAASGASWAEPAALPAARAARPAPVASEPPSLLKFLTNLLRPQEAAPVLAPAISTMPVKRRPQEAVPVLAPAISTAPVKRRPQGDPARKAEPPSLYRPLIVKHATEHGVPVALADAVVRVESRYNTQARNGGNLGLTQISYRTAQAIGYSGTESGLFDADTNLRFGIKYLAQAYKLAGGDTCRTILKYQAGHRAVAMSGAADAYCARVRALMAEQ